MAGAVSGAAAPPAAAATPALTVARSVALAAATLAALSLPRLRRLLLLRRSEGGGSFFGEDADVVRSRAETSGLAAPAIAMVVSGEVGIQANKQNTSS